MEKSPMDHARFFAEDALRNMPSLIDKIRCRRKPIDLRACYEALGRYHLKLGVYKYFVEGDLQSFKQNLHVTCKLDLAAIALDSYQRFSVGNEIFNALFTDNAEIINTMARLEPPYFLSACHNPLNPQFKVHMWQLAILGDYETLRTKVTKLAKNGVKADRKLAAEGNDFFSLLMRGDQQGLENLIHLDALIKSADPVTEDLMSFLGCLEAKLCWFKGIRVQIDSPLVPMELMPDRPLEHYDDVYDFLQPGWVPPPQSLLGKLSRWLKESA
jgi:Immunity protein 49